VIRAEQASGQWLRDQLILVLGPIVLSLVLVGLYATGLLPVTWPELLLLVVTINLAGDVALAVLNERSLKHGRVRLRNDIVGQRALADEAFGGAGGMRQGMVSIAGERWRAVCDSDVAAGEPLRVTGRRGLVLEVAADPANRS